MTVFRETLTVNLRFHDFWGYQKLKNKGAFHLKPRVFDWEGGQVDFIETKGIQLRRRLGGIQGLFLSRIPLVSMNTIQPPSQSKPLVSMKPPASFSVETLGFNETIFSFNFWTPKNRETADILLKFHWNRQKKKKCEVSF